MGVDEALATEIKGSLESTADDEDDDEIEIEAPKASPAHDRMEKTLVQAKQTKALLDCPLPVAKLAQVKAEGLQKTIDKMVRSGAALTVFEPFGRDVERRHFLLTAKNGFELVASTESQACFANAFLELLTSPTTGARAPRDHLLAPHDLRQAPRRGGAASRSRPATIPPWRPPSSSTASAAPASSRVTCS